MKRSPEILRLLAILAVVTGALYWPTTHHGFLFLDDPNYVVNNAHVNHGISWEAARWAFTSYESANWHPLTWLSHQADWSCYGAFGGGHHLTNLLLHTLNTLLLFLVLRRLTGDTGASWIVAALFGWHPLHVESVAWIAERKDLLSALSLVGTLWAYSNYARARQHPIGDGIAAARLRGWGWYGATLIIFAAGLMCKPMLVTLPCLLLLLDSWPLKRGTDPFDGDSVRNWAKLLVEKLPFFALSATACVITVAAQKSGDAIRNRADVPIDLRVLNSLSAYGEYLRQALWPNPLCIFYPLPHRLPLVAALVSALFLAAISSLALWRRKESPWLITGWLWFLGSLVPVIGLIQVGSQAHADRYMYIPSIGLFVAVVWTGQRLARPWRHGKEIAIGLAATGLMLCLVLTRQQLHHWDSDIDLVTHALAHTENNATVQDLMGVAYARADKSQEAIQHYRESLRLNPDGPPVRLRLGVELAASGQLEEAALQFSQLRRQFPHSKAVLNNLGIVRARQGNYEEGLAVFLEEIRWNPTYPKAYHNAATLLQKMGQAEAAVT